MAKPKGIFKDFRLRMNDTDDVANVYRLFESGQAQYNSLNKVLQKAIRVGLPILMEKAFPETTMAGLVNSSTEIIIEQINRKFDDFDKDMRKLMYAIYIGQEMNTLLINLTEKIYEKETGMKLTVEMRDKLISDMPEPLQQHLQKYIRESQKNIKEG